MGAGATHRSPPPTCGRDLRDFPRCSPVVGDRAPQTTTNPPAGVTNTRDEEGWAALRAERSEAKVREEKAKEAIRLEVQIQRDCGGEGDPVKTGLIRQHASLVAELGEEPDKALDAEYSQAYPHDWRSGSLTWDFMVPRRLPGEEAPSVLFRRSL